MKKFPDWLKRPMPINAINQMNKLLKDNSLHTVCMSARCPNIGECFQNKEATFMILGNICTRNCHFCAVKSSKPHSVDSQEADRIVSTIKELALQYVVITSVTRDDLGDGGAAHFAYVIDKIKASHPKVKVEVLTPDFNHNTTSLDRLIVANCDVFAHNIETVASLYKAVRPQADYKKSLFVLDYVKNNSDILTKSGIILGLGETEEEVVDAMQDLRSAGCSMLTLGQYLQPSTDCLEIQEFITPDKFKYYKRIALQKGFLSVKSSPFTRSSYKAKEAYREVINKNECSYA